MLSVMSILQKLFKWNSSITTFPYGKKSTARFKKKKYFLLNVKHGNVEEQGLDFGDSS